MKTLRFLALLASLLTAAAAHAQTPAGSVGIGTSTPTTSALLELKATNKGFLPPRLSQAQRDAIASPAAGLTVFNTTTNALNVWDGTSWAAYLADTSPITFTYTGGPQTYTVPPGVTRLRVVLAGAAGGSGGYGAGGLGGQIQAELPVTPGQVLTIYVGGAGGRGAAGYNGGGAGVGGGSGGGGGGGATDLRTYGYNRVLIAGGGGGAGADPYASGGCGGGLAACGGSSRGSGGGGGGTQSSAGSGGLPNGAAGSAGNGGSGGVYYGGGGGGGYRGGGGGGGAVGGVSGGGGGSSYADGGASDVEHTQGAQAGDGYARLTPLFTSAPAPALDGSNFVNVPGTWEVSGANVYRSSGNVGIGTAAPVAQLEVQLPTGSAAASLKLEQRGSNLIVRPLSAGSGTSLIENTAGNLLLQPSNGNVGIGTTAPAYKLDVNGTIRGSNVSPSDQRFKTQVRPLTGALAAARRLRGVRYHWNALGVQHGGQAGAEQVGFLAQEVEAIYPELVSTDAQGYKAVNYAQLAPVLIEALKDQQQQIEVLQAQAAQAAADHASLLSLQAQLARLLRGELAPAAAEARR